MGSGPNPPDGPALDGSPSPSATLVSERATRERFRSFLERRVGGVDHAAWYFDQVRPRLATDAEARRAAEEIIDHVARLMGFESTRFEDDAVSTWRTASGARLLVALVDDRDAIAGLSRATRSSDALASGSDEHTVGLLCVVTGHEGREALHRALELRRVGRAVRIVGADRLLALARAVARGSVSHALAAAVLTPGASADAVVHELAEG